MLEPLIPKAMVSRVFFLSVEYFFINKGFYDYHMNTLLYCFNIVCDMGDQ